MKCNYIFLWFYDYDYVLNVLLITDNRITQDLYFKENQFEGRIISLLR